MNAQLSKFCLILGLCFLVHVSCGQGLSISGGINYGTFAMKDLKTFQTQTLSSMPAHATIVSDFPAYIGFEGQLYQRTSVRMRVGVYYSFNSTGGRVSYADYSGSYNVDQTLQGHQAGITADYCISSNPNGSTRVYLLAQLGGIYTMHKLHGQITLNNATVTEQTVNFKASSLAFSPGLAVGHDLTERFFLRAEARYLFDSQGELKDPDGVNLAIQGTPSNPGGGKAYSDWSGMRLALIVGVKLGN